jgi:nickel-dependent lactate racemase
MNIEIPRRLWYDNSSFTIELPDTWDVRVLTMRGRNRPPLPAADIERAIQNPIGSAKLSELARGKTSAVIVFDDITRPTRISEIAPVVIRELVAGGMDEDNITFVAALGNHGAHTHHEFRKKLGERITERFRVFNHNPYEHCTLVGTTSHGTKLAVNREVMEADLRIGIGCVTAHINTGFSGGGKIILPGVASIDSAAHYHIHVKAQAPETTGPGTGDENIMRQDIDEAARMAGLHFKIDAIVNERGQTTALFAGDFKEEHRQAVKLAREVYSVGRRPEGCRLVIANAFVKANEMFIAARIGASALADGSGTVVIIADSPEGQIPHYLQRSFGRAHGGRQVSPTEIPPGVRIIVLAPQWDAAFTDWVKNPEAITRTRDWKETLALLAEEFGPGRTPVAVLPEATIVYFEP